MERQVKVHSENNADSGAPLDSVGGTEPNREPCLCRLERQGGESSACGNCCERPDLCGEGAVGSQGVHIQGADVTVHRGGGGSVDRDLLQVEELARLIIAVPLEKEVHKDVPTRSVPGYPTLGDPRGNREARVRIGGIWADVYAELTCDGQLLCHCRDELDPDADDGGGHDVNVDQGPPTGHRKHLEEGILILADFRVSPERQGGSADQRASAEGYRDFGVSNGGSAPDGVHTGDSWLVKLSAGQEVVVISRQCGFDSDHLV